GVGQCVVHRLAVVRRNNLCLVYLVLHASNVKEPTTKERYSHASIPPFLTQCTRHAPRRRFRDRPLLAAVLDGWSETVVRGLQFSFELCWPGHRLLRDGPLWSAWFQCSLGSFCPCP